MTFDLGRTSAFAALLIVLAGYWLVFRPLEATLADRYAELDVARASIERRLALARRISPLERERTELETQLRRTHATVSGAESVERFLRDAAAVSARDRVAVESVAGAVGQPAVAVARAPQAVILDELPLDITLRGHYGDVIRAVRDLGNGQVPARLTLASLGVADRRPGERPNINATFHATLLREPDAATLPRLHPL